MTYIPANQINSNYGYDPLYELIQVTQGGSTTESYSYDPVGNRLSSLRVPSYSYNSSNELTSNSNGSYTYDNNGNTLTDAQGRTFTWDFENRLVQAYAPAGGTTTYKYDPFGRRIQKVTIAGLTNYLYDGPNIVETVDGAGNAMTRLVGSQGVDEWLAEMYAGTTNYYDQDGLGSVTSLSGTTAQLTDTYVYDSFGKLQTSVAPIANSLEYTGRESDAETGLYYNRNRYYDSSFGRFLSEDPFRFFAGSNFYAYAKNQSPNVLDAFGLVGSHPGSIDGAWNQARMLLSDPDCAKFLKTLLEGFNRPPDLDFFLHNFDNTNFGFTPANDPFRNPDSYMAHVDNINGGSTVHVSRWAATPSNCCKLGVTLLHEVLHTIAYGWDDFELATKVGYQGPNKVKPASRYFSKQMESHCVKACQK